MKFLGVRPSRPQQATPGWTLGIAPTPPGSQRCCARGRAHSDPLRLRRSALSVCIRVHPWLRLFSRVGLSFVFIGVHSWLPGLLTGITCLRQGFGRQAGFFSSRPACELGASAPFLPFPFSPFPTRPLTHFPTCSSAPFAPWRLRCSIGLRGFPTTDSHGWTRIPFSLSVCIRVHPWLEIPFAPWRPAPEPASPGSRRCCARGRAHSGPLRLRRAVLSVVIRG
jgi:hypothetical protein